MIARSGEGLHTLAAIYYNYRQAIRDSEFYHQRFQQYEHRLLLQEEKMVNPEHYMDQDVVEQRVTELVAEYEARNRPTLEDATTPECGQPGLPLEEDDDAEDEENGDEYDVEEPELFRPNIVLPEVIPDSDHERRENSLEL